MPQHHGDFFAALAQRRHAQNEAVQAVVEIFAEGLLRDGLRHVDVGGRQHADIDLHGIASAQARELAVLQDLQQLGLQRRRHLADFVQQQRALVAQLELAGLGLVGAGERARLIAEQLALQQFAGHGGAIHLQEGAVRAVGILVNQVRQYFFAGTALAQQQDREIEARHLHGLGAKLAHLRSSGEEVDALADFDGFAGAGAAGLGVLQAEAQHLVHLFLLHRLGKIILRAQPHGLRHLAGIANAGQHDDLGRRTDFADALQGLQPISSGHHHIEQHQVGIDALHLLDGFGPIARPSSPDTSPAPEPSGDTAACSVRRPPQECGQRSLLLRNAFG